MGAGLPVLLTGVIRQRRQIVVDLVGKRCSGEESTEVICQVPPLAFIWLAPVFRADEKRAFEGGDHGEIRDPHLVFLAQPRAPCDEVPARLAAAFNVPCLILAGKHNRAHRYEESCFVGPGEVAGVSDDHRVRTE